MPTTQTISVLNRLKLELNNKSYYNDETYSILLLENELQPTDTYNKSTMYKNLLFTVLSIFETLANDTDAMRSIETEFSNTTEAYKYIDQRIGQIKDKIASIPEPEEEYSMFSLMYTRKPKTDFTDWTNPKPHTINNTDIDKIYE